jgi:hypothetical protein
MEPRRAQILGAEIAVGMSSWLLKAQAAKKRLMRPAVRQARCARDDFAGARSESSEIDGRDLAALLEERGYSVLGIGPPFVPAAFLFFLLSRHGNTQNVPPCLFI